LSIISIVQLTNIIRSVRDPLSSGLVRHPNQVISAFVTNRQRADVDRLVSLRVHLRWLPPALLLFPHSSRFPDDIILIRRQTERTIDDTSHQTFQTNNNNTLATRNAIPIHELTVASVSLIPSLVSECPSTFGRGKSLENLFSGRSFFLQLHLPTKLSSYR
ncbi:hypothetical protein T01_9532, partial [Trichinella spiralis]